MCGENELALETCTLGVGSSPRVRGKLTESRAALDTVRLIPACAGKTSIEQLEAIHAPAHPRVCGENRGEFSAVVTAVGSSPRVRGKPAIERRLCMRRGLIPACAGKT